MTIYALMKSISTRLVRCHVDIAYFACIATFMCLMGQGVYMLTAPIAHFMSDPWFGYAAHAFRIILFTTAAVMFFTVFVLIEARFFRCVWRDAYQYFNT